MALYTFGGTPADVLTDSAGNVVPDYPLLVKVAGTGATVTALFEEDGTTPIGTLRTNDEDSDVPGAVRTFKAADVTAIDYEYNGPSGPVRWYEAARELPLGAMQTAQAAAEDAAEALDGLDDKLDKAGGTVTGDLTVEGTLTAESFAGALEGARFFTVEGAVGNGTADDRAVIQAALDAAHAAGGGTVIIPGGRTYGVSTFLVVYENTTVWAYGATLKAIGNAGLLRNFLGTDSFATYSGRSHIAILGGIWDGNASDGVTGTVTATTNVMGFCHASDITVRDAIIRNVSSAHGCELNAIDGGRVLNCRFEGYRDNSGDNSRQFSESVQIDIAKSGSSSIGDFDNTPSKNIMVRGCYMGPSSRLGVPGRAVGSHTTASGVYYDNIQVIGNRVEGTLQEGIRGYGWRRAVIADNVISGTGKSGVAVTVPDPASAGYALTPHSVTVQDNVIDTVGDDSGIRVLGYATAKISGVAVSGNTIRSITGNAIHCEHCAAPAVTGNHADTTTSTGLYAHYSDGAVIAGNTVKSAGSNGINVAGAVSAAVTGNHVDTTSSNFGIFVGQGADGSTNSSDVTVTGNKIRKAASAGIRLSTNATGCLVCANQVRKDGAATANGLTMAASATGAMLLNNDFSGNSWSAATAMSVSTAAPVTGPGGMQALPGSNRVDTDLTVGTALEAAMKPSGRYETCSRLHVGTASTAPSGTLVLVPIELPAGWVVSNISFTSGATGATSPTNYWFMLLDKNRVALARTADQTTTAWAANTRKTLAIAQTTAGSASSYTTTYEGLHYLGVMIAASAAPNLIGEGTCSTVHVDSPGFGSSDTGQTTPPTVTAGAFTAAAPSTGLGYLFYGYVT